MAAPTATIADGGEAGDIYHERQRLMLCGLHALNALIQPHTHTHTGSDTEADSSTAAGAAGAAVRGPFTKAELDGICDELAAASAAAGLTPGGGWLTRFLPTRTHTHTHRHALGLGDYDVNVLVAALAPTHACAWHDARRGADTIPVEDSELVGFLVNHEGVGAARERAGLEGEGEAAAGSWFGGVAHAWSRLTARVGLGSGRHWLAIRRVNGVWWDLDSALQRPQRVGDNARVREYVDAIVQTGGHVLLVRELPPAARAAGELEVAPGGGS